MAYLKKIFLTFFFMVCLFIGVYGHAETKTKAPTAHVLEISGPISPAVTDYVRHAFSKALDENADFLIIKLHTPGGPVTAMQDIIQNILTSPIPVVTYVSPSGSHAASAGTYILYASHIAAMAPATNLGAATPVSMGGESSTEESERSSILEIKSANDAAAYIRELAELRSRNADWAEKAVREAASLGAEEAKAQNVIDIVASDLNDLMTQINGRVVTVGGRNVVLRTSGVKFVDAGPDWRIKFLMIITNPNIAFLLMTIGFYGIIYEFANPGAFLPGIIGVICIAVGLFALNVLPVNYAGIALLLFGVLLMTGEAFVPSFGVLGIAGAIAFALGGTILIDTDILGFGVAWEVITFTTVLSVIVLAVLLSMATRAHRRKITTGEEALIGSEARVLSWHGTKGEIHTWGERWAARSAMPLDLNADDTVYVTGKERLTLIISNIKPDTISPIEGE